MKKHILTACLSILLQTCLFGQYIDLPNNIEWTGGNVAAGTATVETVETGYNYGRQQENYLLGTAIPNIDFPSETVWNTMTVNQKALWIVNEERTARGLMPFEDTAQQLITIAQDYTQFLVDNDTTGHRADDKSPEIRLRENPDIDVCMQRFAENIGYVFSGYSVPPSCALERMIYWLIYEDSIAGWGHRKAFFHETYTDYSGVIGKEGLLGTGFVIGQNFVYNGFTWNYVAMSTFNMTDPCSSWIYPSPPTPSQLNGADLGIQIFSNNSSILISGIEQSKITNIQICDILGKQYTDCASIDCVSNIHFESGVYFVRITHKTGTVTCKVVI